MKKIKLKEKTTFENIDNVRIIILDHRGIIFYDSKFLGKKPKFFNLSEGNYLTDNNIKKAKDQYEYKLKKLPLKERNLKKDNYIVKFGHNPNKCSIWHKGEKKGLILFDTSFIKKPLYILDFMLFHELGHNHYKTEWKADRYAVNMMLKKGYNPSQIALAPIQSLKEINDNRKMKVIKILK